MWRNVAEWQLMKIMKISMKIIMAMKENDQYQLSKRNGVAAMSIMKIIMKSVMCEMKAAKMKIGGEI